MFLAASLQQISTLIKNAGWMLFSESIARASRLLTIIALAACLSVSDLGIALLAVALHEFFKIIIRAGTGSRLVQASEDELPLIAPNAKSVQWMIYLFLFVLQSSLAYLLGLFYSSESLQWLLQIMALSYLFYPGVSLNVFMLQRENNMKAFATGSAICLIAENIGCAILVFFIGIYSVGVAKIIAALAWYLYFNQAKVARFTLGFDVKQIIDLLKYSRNIFGSEVLRTLRCHVDLVIAGKILSPEIFGIYSFAKNAGVGLSQSLIAAYTSVLYPFLCKMMRDTGSVLEYKRIYFISGSVSLVFIVQSLAAPFYVKLLFAEQWHQASSLVSILCLVAIPSILIETESCIHRSRNELKQEFYIQLYAVCILLASIIIFNPNSAVEFSKVVAACSLLWLILYAKRIPPMFITSFKRARS